MCILQFVKKVTIILNSTGNAYVQETITVLLVPLIKQRINSNEISDGIFPFGKLKNDCSCDLHSLKLGNLSLLPKLFCGGICVFLLSSMLIQHICVFATLSAQNNISD